MNSEGDASVILFRILIAVCTFCRQTGNHVTMLFFATLLAPEREISGNLAFQGTIRSLLVVCPYGVPCSWIPRLNLRGRNIYGYLRGLLGTITFLFMKTDGALSRNPSSQLLQNTFRQLKIPHNSTYK